MRTARMGLAAVVAAALLGCRSYTPRPLDLHGHREAWLARSPADERVEAFARRLWAEDGEQEGAFTLSDGLSMREGEAVALLFNPRLRLARLRAEGAGASATHAGLWDDPEFGVDVERILESVPEPWMVGASLGITIPVSGRLRAAKDVAGAEHRAALQRVVAEEWEVRIALRRAWLEWSAQRQRVEIARELLERLESVLGVVGELEKAGELSRTEARFFRIERAARVNGLRADEAAMREMEISIKGMMGLAPGATVELVPAGLVATGETSDGLLAVMEARSPVLAARRAEYEVAEETLRMEMREQFPDVTIAPGFGTEDGEDRVLMGVSLPVPLWNRNRRGIAEAESQRELARAAFETEYERLAISLAVAETRLASARARRRAIETEIVPMVEEQDAEARRIAELGEVDTLVQLETLTRLFEAKAALVEAWLAEGLAVVGVDELVGPPERRETGSEGDAP